jgi:hypothetical protein
VSVKPSQCCYRVRHWVDVYACALFTSATQMCNSCFLAGVSASMLLHLAVQAAAGPARTWHPG